MLMKKCRKVKFAARYLTSDLLHIVKYKSIAYSTTDKNLSWAEMTPTKVARKHPLSGTIYAVLAVVP